RDGVAGRREDARAGRGDDERLPRTPRVGGGAAVAVADVAGRAIACARGGGHGREGGNHGEQAVARELGGGGRRARRHAAGDNEGAGGVVGAGHGNRVADGRSAAVVQRDGRTGRREDARAGLRDAERLAVTLGLGVGAAVAAVAGDEVVIACVQGS